MEKEKRNLTLTFPHLCIAVMLGLVVIMTVPSILTNNEIRRIEHVRSWLTNLEFAVENFHYLNNRLPESLEDPGKDGKTLCDMFKEIYGRYTNPYTGKAELPVNGTPEKPGMIGYESFQSNGVCFDYAVTGMIKGKMLVNPHRRSMDERFGGRMIE